MSLHIYISHTGQRLLANLNTLFSPEALRIWIADQTAISPSRQILMTARGKNVKQLHLLNEAEIFVYDKQYISADIKPPSSSNRPQPTLRRLRDPPSSISNETSLQSWQELFMARRTWALEATEMVNDGVDSAQVYADEIEVIGRATTIALNNLKNHVASLRHNFESTQKWASEALEEHKAALNDWQASVDVLAEVPIRSDLASLLHRPTTPTRNNVRKQPTWATLRELADLENLKNGATDLEAASRSFGLNLQELEDSMDELLADTAQVGKYGESSWQGRETSSSLLEESETLAKRVIADYEDILRYQDNPKSVAAASRRALIHTRDLLPGLQGVAEDLNQLITSSVIRRNELSENCLLALQELSKLESRLGDLQSRVSNFDLEQRGIDGLEMIQKVFHLPVAYGSTLVEAVRRAEWTKRMASEIGSLHDEVSLHTEDEAKRRLKWAKSMSEFLQDATVPEHTLIDVNFSNPENTWPDVTSDEIVTYIDTMRALGIDDAVQQVSKITKEVEVAGKPRKRTPKAFKNGSVHDLNQSSLFQGTGEEFKSLQDDKVRLEDKLRASDSRVRKLEDLLHRQSQLTRPPSGNFGGFPDSERHVSSPTISLSRPNDLLSRKSSSASRRPSNQSPDDKGLVQKIVGLEAEILKLQREAHVERRSSTESRDKMEEAESVKRDLMANFDAQKQEFDDERQLLEDEAQKLKIRIEEMEDELDRMAGSREHQRNSTDKTINNLRAEIERLRWSSADELKKAQNKFETAESSLHVQRDRAMSLEKQIQQHKEERSGLQDQNMALASRLRDVEQEQQDHISALQAAHDSLSPGGQPPEELRRLVRAIEILSEGAAIHSRGQDEELQLTTAENKALEEKLAHAESQAKLLKGQIASEEATSSALRETLMRERTNLASVRAELVDEQTELKGLRTKFAAGETGSEALKEQITQEEKKVAELTQRLTVAEVKAQSAEFEVESIKAKLDSMTTRERELVSHLDSRGSKAKELSQKLFHHNDRMIRMLEQLGYSVTRQDNALVIQRASRVHGSITLPPSSMIDASYLMKRTASGSSPTQHYADISDLDTLYWMSDMDADGENTKFQGFMSSLSRLDLDATIELITKRYKDVETLAKKYQKDSRGYREKSHRLQSEAHDKIAYRSFKEGDLALFLPTRNQATRPWAAFNVGAPHYFLREQDAHKLQSRDWLLARIGKVEERIVDLSRSLGSTRGQHDRSSLHTDASDGASTRSADDENPFELSDGLRWYMIDASEEKPGAPTTPGLGKSTVAASNVEVKGSMGKKPEKSGGGATNAAVMVTKTLNKSLDSRRSSTGSKKGHTPSPSVANAPPLLVTNEENVEGGRRPTVKPSNADITSNQPAREDAQVFEVGNHDGWMQALDPEEALARQENRMASNSPVREGSYPRGAGQSHNPSPLKQQQHGAASPVKQNTPARSRPWDKLWGIEYRMEGSQR